MSSKKYRPYTQEGNSWMVPKGFSKFARTCIVIQAFKFVYYNLKILRVLNKMEQHH